MSGVGACPTCGRVHPDGLNPWGLHPPPIGEDEAWFEVWTRAGHEPTTLLVVEPSARRSDRELRQALIEVLQAPPFEDQAVARELPAAVLRVGVGIDGTHGPGFGPVSAPAAECTHTAAELIELAVAALSQPETNPGA